MVYRIAIKISLLLVAGCATGQVKPPEPMIDTDIVYTGRFPCMHFSDLPKEVENGLRGDCGKYGLVPSLIERDSYVVRCESNWDRGYVATYQCVEPTNE